MSALSDVLSLPCYGCQMNLKSGTNIRLATAGLALAFNFAEGIPSFVFLPKYAYMLFSEDHTFNSCCVKSLWYQRLMYGICFAKSITSQTD